jgi:3-oxoacyl-[acyl-carrier protein] reductase
MKHAIITGGTKGIGKAIGASLLERGYSVILNYSEDDNVAQQVYEEFSKKYAGRIYLIKEDLSNYLNIEQFISKVKQITQIIDILILNMGITDRSELNDITYDSWNKVIHTNLTIPFFIIQKLVANMPAESSVIFTGSLMGIVPHSVSISY